MVPPIDTTQPLAVQAEVQKAYAAMFPHGNRDFVSQVFGWVNACFAGEYRDYLPIDARYHDLEHTLQGTLCMARLLQARHKAKAQPPIDQRLVELGIIAILLHDTGYLKQRGDDTGTGAKYTLTHVDRSVEFAATLMSDHGYYERDIASVQRMIRCTGVNVKLDAIAFESEAEKVTGFGLGTADLLGQMAAEDYVEKLPILYAEFAESARYTKDKAKGGGFFNSVEDLMQKTPMFWDKYVRAKISNDFLGLYQFLSDPYPNGHNWYIDRIEHNMTRLQRELGVSA
ncbi:MAG: hypothetical protein JWO95_689 [Verrucomicrobiales bacterium]|nr:hypothetical protein [Verrucomicrobiales bacterium]